MENNTMKPRIPQTDLIQTFAAVAKYGSMTEAGKHIYLTVPAVQNRINRLEQQRGQTLFRRGKFGMRLTGAGKALLKELGGETWVS